MTQHGEVLVSYDGFIQETGIDEETSKELYEVFVEELLQEKEKLIAQHLVKDYEKLGRTVHNVKGVSGSYKAHFVYESAKVIDLCIKGREYEGVEQEFDGLIKAIGNAIDDIRLHFKI